MDYSASIALPDERQPALEPSNNDTLQIPTYTLDRNSEFGTLLGPLYDTLTELRDKSPTRSIKDITWKLAAFPYLHNAFREKDLLAISPSLEDQMFTMVDEVADQIRRIYNHEWLAQYITRETQKFAPTLADEDLEPVSEIADILRANGFSRFIGNGASRQRILEAFPQAGGLVVDSARVAEVIARINDRSAVLNAVIRDIDFGLDKVCAERAASLYDIWNAYRYDSKQSVITDPDHIWNNLSCDFRSYIVWRMDQGLPYKLDKPVSFMIVEDNPLHQWIFSSLIDVRNALLYSPPEARRQEPNTLIHPFCYQSVTDAESAIIEALDHGLYLPDVIISDIELLDSDRNGLDLIESIDQKLKEAGRRKEVQLVMVYSSNLRIYDERVTDLISRGIIDGARTKRDFKLENLIKVFVSDDE